MRSIPRAQSAIKGNEPSLNSNEPLIEVGSDERDNFPVDQQEPRRRNGNVDREVQACAAVVLYAPLQAALVEERATPLGRESWVRARFGDFLTPWIEEWQMEPVG